MCHNPIQRRRLYMIFVFRPNMSHTQTSKICFRSLLVFMVDSKFIANPYHDLKERSLVLASIM